MEEDNKESMEIDSGNLESLSSIYLTGVNFSPRADNNLGDNPGNPYPFDSARQQDSVTFGVSDQLATLIRNNELAGSNEKKTTQCAETAEPFCHVKLDSLAKLKDSTRKLLALLEEIQTNTNESEHFCPIKLSNSIHQTSSIVAEKDDCSVYKRLTRKCHCLNQVEYNNFIIHFNETTKYFTSAIGEIIKNIRIVKKFIYMGSDYTKHALKFLNEGLTNSAHVEKVDIAHGCSHADVCNVFDDQSIVVVCIAWPCIDNAHGDSETQSLAASFLNKLAQLEEGRRYLKFSSKIANDLKKVVRKKSAKIDYETLEQMNETLNLLNPPLLQNSNVTYYCKPVDEGFGGKTMNTLVQYREFMTLEEIFTHLDLLHNLSNNSNGKSELAAILPTMLKLFKCLITEYDDSELNIIITNILNNIVQRKMIKPKASFPRTVFVAETATEAVKTRDQTNQVPMKPVRPSKRSLSRSKQRVSESPQSRSRLLPKTKGLSSAYIKSKEPPSLIVVPVKKPTKFS